MTRTAGCYGELRHGEAPPDFGRKGPPPTSVKYLAESRYSLEEGDAGAVARSCAQYTSHWEDWWPKETENKSRSSFDSVTVLLVTFCGKLSWEDNETSFFFFPWPLYRPLCVSDFSINQRTILS